MRGMLAAGAAVALSLVLAAAATGRSGASTLKGTVGPGFTITLKQNGKKVTRLKAGKYTFVIADKASIHNFELEQESGGKSEKELTHVSFVGTKTVQFTLRKGKWKYYCKPHESTMFGFFQVT
jgi:plastocyanin